MEWSSEHLLEVLVLLSPRSAWPSILESQLITNPPIFARREWVIVHGTPSSASKSFSFTRSAFAAQKSAQYFPRSSSGATMVISIHVKLFHIRFTIHLISPKIPGSLCPRCSETLRWRTVYVQAMIVNRQLQSISIVPRVSALETKLTTLRGKEHLVPNLV